MIKPEYVEQMCKDEYEINTNEDIQFTNYPLCVNI